MRLVFFRYVAYARKNIKPRLTPEAAEALKNHYVDFRRTAKQKEVIPCFLNKCFHSAFLGRILFFCQELVLFQRFSVE